MIRAQPASRSRFYRLVTPIQPSSNADSDGDGIPDSWMLQYFGHSTGLAIDNSLAQDDADGDGMTNLQEYWLGRIHFDPQSVLKLRVLGSDPGTGRPQYSFTAIAGIGYTLLYSDSLAPPIWRKLRDVPVDVTTRAILVDDPPPRARPMRFYRVVTPMQSFWNPDSDGDGIPDSWMLQIFGHPTGLASDHSRARDDADGDGMTNFQEYRAGTDPLDAQSNLKLVFEGMDATTGRPQFSFTAMAGIGYTFILRQPRFRHLAETSRRTGRRFHPGHHFVRSGCSQRANTLLPHRHGQSSLERLQSSHFSHFSDLRFNGSNGSPVPIRPFHFERIWQMTELPDRSVFQEHLDNVETQLHLRILQQPQIIQGRACEPPASLLIDRRGGSDPFFRRASLTSTNTRQSLSRKRPNPLLHVRSENSRSEISNPGA